jgi:cell division septum initiation protein DivIVA
MMESLPVDVQDQVAEHLREYINELQDEIQWSKSFERTQQKLVAAAQRAKQEIAEGKATTLDYDQL